MAGTKIKIVNTDGQIWDTQFDTSTTINAIKQAALKQFFTAQTTNPNAADEFKVIHPEGFRSLNDDHAIQDEKLKDNDVLLLVRKRKLVFSDFVQDADLKAPTKEAILAATKHLGTAHLPPPPPPAKEIATPGPSSSAKARASDCSFDEGMDVNKFQLDLRKILISFLSTMTMILHGNPDVDTICNDMRNKIKRRFGNAQRVLEATGAQTVLPPPPEVKPTPMGIVDGMIEAKKREFRPNAKAFEALKELGFPDTVVSDALRANKNNKDLACDWLLSENHLIPDDVNVGLNQDSQLYKTLISNPTIRLGLHNPKTMLAFLEILESSGNASNWLGDPDLAPVLSAIFKIYHAQKHTIND